MVQLICLCQTGKAKHSIAAMDKHTTQPQNQIGGNSSACFRLFFLCMTRSSFAPEVTNDHVFLQPHQKSIEMERRGFHSKL